jgi:hypothetical protein
MTMSETDTNTETPPIIPPQRVAWEALRASVDTFAAKPDDAPLAQKVVNNLIDYGIECVKCAWEMPAGELVQVLRCGSIELMRSRFDDVENMSVNEMIREEARERYAAALLDFDAALDYFNEAVPPIVTKADMRSVWWQKSSIEERASASALCFAARHLLEAARDNLTDFGATILACDLVMTNLQLVLHDPDSSDAAYNTAQHEFEELNQMLGEANRCFLKSLDKPELRAQQGELLIAAFRKVYSDLIVLLRERRLCTSQLLQMVETYCHAALHDDPLSQLKDNMIASNANVDKLRSLAQVCVHLAREFERRRHSEREGMLLLRAVKTMELGRTLSIAFSEFMIARFDALGPKGIEFISMQISQKMSGTEARPTESSSIPTNNG